MAKRDPRTGELLTTNYGWTKPTVGSSVDAWGGYINSDLDGIDSIVHGVQTSVPAASTTTPAMDGTAAVGTGTTWARADHVHPTDVRIIGDNRIINGDMRIDQRNNGVSGTAINAFTVDRWNYNSNLATKFNWGRNTPAAPGFPYYLFFLTNSAYTLTAADYYIFYQAVEADAVSDFQWGSANAQPVTLSFWAYSSLTGTFGGSIKNYAQTRSYPFTYSIPTANTWTKIVLTIPGDTGGTWVMSGNGGALYVMFSLGAGSTFSGPAGAWASASYNSANGCVSVVGTLNAELLMTGVKLEIGSVATPFNRQSVAKSLADCQRYFEMSYDQGTALGTATVNGLSSWGVQPMPSSTYTPVVNIRFATTKRADPTMVGYSTVTGAVGKVRDYSNSTDVSVSFSGMGQTGCQWSAANSAATTVPTFQLQWTASAEL